MLCRYRFSRGGCLAISRFSGRCFATVVAGLPLWQMLCCRERVDPLLGGCLATMVAWFSLADALPLLLLDAPLSYQGECFATMALSIFRQPLRVIFIAGSVVGLWCWGQSLFFLLFSCSYVYSFVLSPRRVWLLAVTLFGGCKLSHFS